MRVRGYLAPVIGRISMDQCLLDVSAVRGVKVGDIALIFGNDTDVNAGVLSDTLSSITYEVLCGVQERVTRTYQN